MGVAGDERINLGQPEVAVTAHLMTYAMNALRFEEALDLLESCCVHQALRRVEPGLAVVSAGEACAPLSKMGRVGRGTGVIGYELEHCKGTASDDGE